MNRRRARCARPRRGRGSLLSALCAAGLLITAAAVAAELPDGAEPEAIERSGPVDEVIVHAVRTDQDPLAVPAPISVIDRDWIQHGRQRLTLGESLSVVPGVFTQNRTNFAQDLRISIRGFGSRARFGLRGVKLIVDDVPATLPDGQGQVDHLQLGTAGRIEVMRGPSASLYGSAAGGLIRIETEPAPETPQVHGLASAGSNGYRNYQLDASGTNGSLDYLLGLTRQESGGYREHSRMESNVVNSRVGWQLNEASKLTATFNFVYSPVAEDPGALTQAEVDSDRRQAAPRNLQYDAGERVNEVRTSLRYTRTLDEGSEAALTGYFGWRDFRARLPFQNGGEIVVGPDLVPVNGGAVELDRFFGGVSVQHDQRGQLFERDYSVLLGIDADFQRDDRMRRNNDDGTPGALTLDQAENVTSIHVFTYDEYSICANVQLVFSLGFDAIQYEVVDDFLADGIDDSGSRWFNQWSPMGGVVWQPSELANPYVRISTSFEPPTTTELAEPTGAGGFNDSLDAQRAVNYEAGIKGLLPGTVGYDLAVYYVEIQNELVPFELPSLPGRSFYVNASESYRTGVEASLRYQPVDGLITSLAYTFTIARYGDYMRSGMDFTGNLVPGVPEHFLNAAVEYRHATGLWGAFELRYGGPFFANDANTVETDSFVVGDLRFGYDARFGDWSISPHIGFNNLFNAKYIDNVRLNGGFGRYFEPAPEFEAYGGLSIAYHFGGP